MPVTSVIDSNMLSAINGDQTGKKPGAGEEINSNFLTLLVTQLQNQDPLKPMENSELTTQLAQINTVSGIETLNETLQSINTQIGAGQQLQAAGLIGRGVMIEGDQILVGNEGATTPFGVELSRPASDVSISIYSQSGEAVRTFALGATGTDAQTLVWDGLTNSGETAPGGAYKVAVTAVDPDGGNIPVETSGYALINGVSADSNGEALLDIGGVGEPVRLDDIKQIL